MSSKQFFGFTKAAGFLGKEVVGSAMWWMLISNQSVIGMPNGFMHQRSGVY